MATDNERFEELGELYHKATGYLRPGKHGAPGSGHDPGSEENFKRFDAWVTDNALTCALDKIVELSKYCAEQEVYISDICDTSWIPNDSDDM